MSSLLRKKYFIFSVAILIAAHLVAVTISGYFLSPEFTLYAFLTAHGFLPYVNIIDQHFPLLLFGPFSLPDWMTVNPFPLLPVFFATLALTDLFFFFALLRRRTSHPVLWLFIFIVATYWFSGNTLWLETFMNLFLALIFFASGSDSRLANFIKGFFFALILLVKPTFFPALFFLFVYLKQRPKFSFVLGFLLPLLITALYLIKFSLIRDFLYLTTNFNKQYYSVYATKLPTRRQILELVLVFIPSLLLFLRRCNFLKMAIIMAGFILIYPRFEYVHLQPVIILLVLLLSDTLSGDSVKLLAIAALLLFCLAVVKNTRHYYGNFFLDPASQKVAQRLRGMPGTSLYLLGGNDLIYPLSGRVPPSFTYLPSLPWYFKDENLAGKMISALLNSPASIVLIKQHATLDGVNIQNSSGMIGEFIKNNYQAGEVIEDYQIYNRLPK